MRRRQFISGLGSAAAWPAVARARQPAMPVIGVLYGGLSGSRANIAAALQQGLALKRRGDLDRQCSSIKGQKCPQ
jgi:hypothetical protein